ncbi:hypothetical protein [Ideonella paludis]|uniref:Uncharacterized protein n=1 Tax=Ideonella paludis TaxID=1233411 RepID=A0ABS5DU49_9BURK|nr:hypothetical protein [Ideonella paludis]MBQ0934660.1 hypothetical protein [Ideonella paludis]
MFELLSLIFGGLLRLAPEVMKLFTAKQDQAHELRMTTLQLEIDKARADQQIDLVHAQGAMATDSAELAALAEALKGQGQMTGVPLIDAINQSVRPVLTYWWCMVLYTAYKVVTIVLLCMGTPTLAQVQDALVTEFDRMVIASIFSFWFVDRSLRRGRL